MDSEKICEAALVDIQGYLLESIKSWDVGHSTVFDIANAALDAITKAAPIKEQPDCRPTSQSAPVCEHPFCYRDSVGKPWHCCRCGADVE